jgi:hypothetical protein
MVRQQEPMPASAFIGTHLSTTSPLPPTTTTTLGRSTAYKRSAKQGDKSKGQQKKGEDPKKKKT